MEIDKINTCSRDEIEKNLWDIFRNVNYWLEFAEKKNGILAAAVGVGTLLGFINTSLIELHLCPLSAGIRSLGVLLILAGWAHTLYSFTPKTKFDRVFQIAKNGEDQVLQTDNLLFWGHAAKYGQEKYLQAIMNRYEFLEPRQRRLSDDLCGQIVTNSAIARRKYTLFGRAINFIFSGLFVIALGLLLKGFQQ